MNAVRQIVDSNELSQVIRLPKSLQNRQVEVIVMPIVESPIKRQITRSQLKARLSGSVTEAITGVLPDDADVNLGDLRAERRAKYESFD